MCSEEFNRYEKLVLEEDAIYRKIHTCNRIETMVLDDVFESEKLLERDAELVLLVLADVNQILYRQLVQTQLD